MSVLLRRLPPIVAIATLLCLVPASLLAAERQPQAPSVVVFLWQITALLVCGRLLVS
jgi:hypothetical protein